MRMEIVDGLKIVKLQPQANLQSSCTWKLRIRAQMRVTWKLLLAASTTDSAEITLLRKKAWECVKAHATAVLASSRRRKATYIIWQLAAGMKMVQQRTCARQRILMAMKTAQRNPHIRATTIIRKVRCACLKMVGQKGDQNPRNALLSTCSTQWFSTVDVRCAIVLTIDVRHTSPAEKNQWLAPAMQMVREGQYACLKIVEHANEGGLASDDFATEWSRVWWFRDRKISPLMILRQKDLTS